MFIPHFLPDYDKKAPKNSELWKSVRLRDLPSRRENALAADIVGIAGEKLAVVPVHVGLVEIATANGQMQQRFGWGGEDGLQ